MEEMQGSNMILQNHQVEVHIVQVLNSSLAVEEVVVVEIMKTMDPSSPRVEEEVMAEQPFVYLPSIRLRLMAQS